MTKKSNFHQSRATYYNGKSHCLESDGSYGVYTGEDFGKPLVQPDGPSLQKIDEVNFGFAIPCNEFRVDFTLPYQCSFVGQDESPDEVLPDSDKENDYDLYRAPVQVDDEVIRAFYHLGHLLWLQQVKRSDMGGPPPPPPPPPRKMCQSTHSQTELRFSDIEGMGSRLGVLSQRIQKLVEDESRLARCANLLELDLTKIRAVLAEVTADRDSEAHENSSTISKLNLEVFRLKEELSESKGKALFLEKALELHEKSV